MASSEDSQAAKQVQLKKLAVSACTTTVLLLTYCVVGAWTIAAIEGPLEIIRKSKAQLAQDFVQSLMTLAHFAPCNTTSNETKGYTCVDELRLRNVVRSYHTDVLPIVVQSGVTVNHPIWTFVSSTYYCWTLAVTVGFGNFCPTSVPGKVFTMLYSLLGTPLLILNATKLGTVFTIALSRLKTEIVLQCAAWVKHCRTHLASRSQARSRRRGDLPLLQDDPKVRIEKLNQRLAKLVKERSRRPFRHHESIMPLWIAAVIFPLYIAFVAALFYIFEPLSYFECFYFAFITFTSIGFGDIVPQKELEFLLLSFFIFLGVGLCASVVECMELRLSRTSRNLRLYIIDEFGPEGNKKQ